MTGKNVRLDFLVPPKHHKASAFRKDVHFETSSAATTQTIDLPPWSLSIPCWRIISLHSQPWICSALRAALVNPFETKGDQASTSYLPRKESTPVRRHHPSANKNWFHLIFLCYDDLSCYTVIQSYRRHVRIFFNGWFWLLPDFQKTNR